MNYLIVFLGAGVGGAVRHAVNVITGPFSAAFPFGTFVVNIVGSFLMGVIAEYFALKSHLPQPWRLFLTTGILGGFTTFSTFSLDAALLYERGRIGLAALYVLSSVVFAVLGLISGLAIIRALVAVPR